MEQLNEKILYGGSYKIVGDEKSSVAQVLYQHLDSNSSDQNLLILESTTGNGLSTSQLFRQSKLLAWRLKSIGFTSSDVVAICSTNRLEYPVAVCATLFLGAILTSLNPDFDECEIKHILDLTKPKLLFGSKVMLKKVQKLNLDLKIILFDEDEDTTTDVLSYRKFLGDIQDNYPEKKIICNEVDIATKTAFYYFTSGTTGLPKCIELTHLNVCAAITQLYYVWDKPFFVSVIPWYHVYGMILLFFSILKKAKLVSVSKFNEENYLQTIEKYQPNALLVVCPIVQFLGKSPLVQKYNLSSVKKICSSGALLSETDITSIGKTMGSTVKIIQAYGSTELSLLGMIQNDNYCIPGSIGCLARGVWGKIIDSNTGQVLGANERGEMCLKGKNVMKGYLNNRSATEDVIDTDGWFHSKDYGYYNEQNEWFVLGRFKDMIRYKGLNILPSDIECLLMSHPMVLDAAVIGIVDAVNGELPLGVIVQRPGSNLTEVELMKYVEDTGKNEHCLHGGIIFVNKIPKNPTGKILRRELIKLTEKK